MKFPDKKFFNFALAFSIAFALISCNKNESHKIPRTPEWAKKAVWYQIFPERFNNGDKYNDPRREDILGAWPFEAPANWQISPWTSDWYKLQSWEAESGRDFYWNSQLRRYGGDIQGIIDKLDYLSDLGINAIYLNPVFESPSLHKYDASMYRHIDNNFGPDPDGDKIIWERENPTDISTWQWTSADKLFLKLIKEAHRRKIRIIIDGVFNHVGRTFWAFRDVMKNQEKSPFVNWFYIKNFDNPETDSNEFDYQGWFGVKSLPELREDENGLVGGPRNHIHNIVNRWMDPNGDGNPEDGIDGWRLDVADMVNHNFWKDFRQWVKDVNPDAYLTGEVWWKDWRKNEMFNAAPWLQGDEFDGVMNYRFTRALKRFAADNKIGINARGFIDSLQTQYSDYDKENYFVMMNLLGSHDTERLASMIVNPDHYYDHYANPAQDSNWLVRKPNPSEIEKQKLMVGLQMTLPGAPHIYYGDEAGMWGGDDPDDRKPMVFPELNYEPETTHPFGKKRPRDEVKFDDELFNWYKKLIEIRKENDALSLGDIQFFIIDDEAEVFGYKRTLNGAVLFIIANNNADEYTLDETALEKIHLNPEFGDLISNVRYSGINKLKLNPYQIMILKAE